MKSLQVCVPDANNLLRLKQTNSVESGTKLCEGQIAKKKMPCESVQASAAKLARLRDECGSPVEPEIAVNIKKVRTTNGSMNSAHLLQLELSTSLLKNLQRNL